MQRDAKLMYMNVRPLEMTLKGVLTDAALVLICQDGVW